MLIDRHADKFADVLLRARRKVLTHWPSLSPNRPTRRLSALTKLRTPRLCCLAPPKTFESGSVWVRYIVRNDRRIVDIGFLSARQERSPRLDNCACPCRAIPSLRLSWLPAVTTGRSGCGRNGVIRKIVNRVESCMKTNR